MKAITLVTALALAAWSLALVPAAEAREPPYQCVRDGPPCSAPCFVGEDYDCLVTVQMYVCVTEPCPGIQVCVLYGRHCLL